MGRDGGHRRRSCSHGRRCAAQLLEIAAWKSMAAAAAAASRFLPHSRLELAAWRSVA
uniref:Uncharacterized protein n=1 Tax=Arundo donax TaxID=35708 RepID=A0A0A9AWD8_ARUDO